MENEDKYVILGHDGQVMFRKEEGFVQVSYREEFVTSVFNKEEAKRFKFPKTYKLVPVDFSKDDSTSDKNKADCTIKSTNLDELEIIKNQLIELYQQFIDFQVKTEIAEDKE